MLFILYDLVIRLINWLINIDWISIVEPLLTLSFVIIGIMILVCTISKGVGKVVTTAFSWTFGLIWTVIKFIAHIIWIAIILILGLIPKFFRWSRRTLKGWGVNPILANVLGGFLTIIFVIAVI